MSTPLNGSLIKAFEVLKLISPECQEISARTVASALGMNTATAHRFLLTLEEVGALVSYRRGYYGLGHRLEELGRLAEATNPLAALVKPVIDRASKDLNESVMACRLGREGPTCMAVAISTQPITVNIQVGTVLPLHATAQGKLWLAEVSAEERQARLKNYAMVAISDNTIADKIQMEQEFERIRKQGFALNRGENEPDIAAAAVPVRSEDGEIFLSLSAFGMLSRFSEALIRRAIDRLKSAAGEIRSARHEVA